MNYFALLALLLLPSLAPAATCMRSMCHKTPHRFAGLAIMSVEVGRELLQEPGDLPRVDWRSLDLRSGAGAVYLSYRLSYKHFAVRKQTWVMPNEVQTTIDVCGDFGNRVDRVSLCVVAAQSREGTEFRTWLTAHTGYGDGRGLFPRWRPLPRLVNRVALRLMPEAMDEVLGEIHDEAWATFAGTGRGLVVRLVDAVGKRR